MTEILPIVNIDGNEVQLNQAGAEDLIDIGTRLENAGNSDADGVINAGDVGFEELTDAQYFLTTSTQNFNSRGIYGNASMSDFLHGAEHNITQMHFDAMQTGVSADFVSNFGAAVKDVGQQVMNAYTGSPAPDGQTPGGGPDGDIVDIDSAELGEIIEAFDGLDDITTSSGKSTALDNILDAILGLVDEDGDGGTPDDGGSGVPSITPPTDDEVVPGDDVIGEDPVAFDGVWTSEGVETVLGEFDEAKQALLDIAIAQYGEDFRGEIEGMSMNDLLSSSDPFLKAAGGMESGKLDFVVRGGNLGDGAVDQGRQEVGDRVDEIILDIANDILNADGTEDITEIRQIVNDTPEELKASGDPILVALGEMMDVSDSIDSGGQQATPPPDGPTQPPGETTPLPEFTPLPETFFPPPWQEPIFEQVTYSAEQLQSMMNIENGSFGLHEDGSLITVGLDKSDEFNAENGTLKINLEEGALRAGMVFQDLFTGESGGDESVTIQALDIDGNVLDEITVTGAESGEQFAEFDGGGVEIASLSIDAADDGFSDYSISGVAVMQEAEIDPNDPNSVIGAIDPNGSYQMDINELIVMLRMLEQLNENVTTTGLGNQVEMAAIDGMINIGREASNLLEAGFSGESVSGQYVIDFALKAGELNDTARTILGYADEPGSANPKMFADDLVDLAIQATGIVIEAARGENT